MGDDTFTFRVDSGLKARFNEIAQSHDRTSAQLLRDFMRDYVRMDTSRLDEEAISSLKENRNNDHITRINSRR